MDLAATWGLGPGTGRGGAVRHRPRRRRWPRAALLAAVLLAAPGATRGDERAWLQVESPGAGPTRIGFGWIEVHGHADPRGQRGHDVVIVIDLSDSTIRSSGVDLDEDGDEGRTDPALLERLARQRDVRDGLLARLRGSDFDDSVLAAELSAAEALLERLDPEQSRVGLVQFSDDAWLLASVAGPRSRVHGALERIRRTFFRDLRGTNFAAAIDAASSALTRAEGRGLPGRERSIVFLSDGSPTLPVHANRAADLALEAAQRAAAAGVRLYAFALGDEALEALDVYHAVAAATGGRLERIERPADLITRLRHIDLADLAALRIENLTTGRRARAVRVFPDGSFDGFVQVAPGANRVAVTARATDGRELRVERLVVLEARDALGDAELAAEIERMRRLREELQSRTRETELWAEIELRRRRPRGELEIVPERDLRASPPARAPRPPPG